jgi:hypothetical protein
MTTRSQARRPNTKTKAQTRGLTLAEIGKLPKAVRAKLANDLLKHVTLEDWVRFGGGLKVGRKTISLTTVAGIDTILNSSGELDIVAAATLHLAATGGNNIVNHTTGDVVDQASSRLCETPAGSPVVRLAWPAFTNSTTAALQSVSFTSGTPIQTLVAKGSGTVNSQSGNVFDLIEAVVSTTDATPTNIIANYGGDNATLDLHGCHVFIRWCARNTGGGAGSATDTAAGQVSYVCRWDPALAATILVPSVSAGDASVVACNVTLTAGGGSTFDVVVTGVNGTNIDWRVWVEVIAN